MNRALSAHAHHVTLGIFGALIVGSSGCSPSYPIVVNPTEPWEAELARERQAARNAEASSRQASVAPQVDETDEEDRTEQEREHSAFVVAVTDIIAFPFRGTGWLARQIF